MGSVGELGGGQRIGREAEGNEDRRAEGATWSEAEE